MSRYIYWLETAQHHRIWPELWAQNEPDVEAELTDSGVFVGQDHVRRVFDGMAKSNEGDRTARRRFMPIPGLDPDRGPTLQSIYSSDGWNRYLPLPPERVPD